MWAKTCQNRFFKHFLAKSNFLYTFVQETEFCVFCEGACRYDVTEAKHCWCSYLMCYQYLSQIEKNQLNCDLLKIKKSDINETGLDVFNNYITTKYWSILRPLLFSFKTMLSHNAPECYYYFCFHWLYLAWNVLVLHLYQFRIEVPQRKTVLFLTQVGQQIMRLFVFYLPMIRRSVCWDRDKINPQQFQNAFLHLPNVQTLIPQGFLGKNVYMIL